MFCAGFWRDVNRNARTKHLMPYVFLEIENTEIEDAEIPHPTCVLLVYGDLDRGHHQLHPAAPDRPRPDQRDDDAADRQPGA